MRSHARIAGFVCHTLPDSLPTLDEAQEAIEPLMHGNHRYGFHVTPADPSLHQSWTTTAAAVARDTSAARDIEWRSELSRFQGHLERTTDVSQHTEEEHWQGFRPMSEREVRNYIKTAILSGRNIW